MARKIDTDAEIDRIRMAMQFSHPSSPDSGYDWLYVVSGSAHGGLYLKDPSGRQIGPFITGTPTPSELDYVQFTSNVSPTATSEGTANTVVTSSAVTYDGSTPIIIEFWCNNARPRADASGNMTLWLYEDGSSIGQIGFISAYEAGAVNQILYGRRRITPTAGSHTYSIRASVSAGTGLVAGGAGGNGNIAPGFIRIVKANP